MKRRKNQLSKFPPVKRKLGDYFLAGFNVVVFIESNRGGGDFSTGSNTLGRPQITIGMNQSDWWGVVQVALHESLEFSMALKDLLFRATNRYTNDSADRLFVFTHSDFTQCVAEAAEFFCAIEDDLKAQWMIERKRVHKNESSLHL